MESQLRVGVDVGCHAHRVGIADPAGSILEEFDISHSEAGFQEFFRRVEERRAELGFPVAVAMEGYNGYARPLDRLVQESGDRVRSSLFTVWICFYELDRGDPVSPSHRAVREPVFVALPHAVRASISRARGDRRRPTCAG